MEIAALILSTISLIISAALTVVFLAKNMFSSHTVQMVPMDSILPGVPQNNIAEDFEEFDMPSAMDAAIEKK